MFLSVFFWETCFPKAGMVFCFKSKKSEGETGVSETAGEASVLSKENWKEQL